MIGRWTYRLLGWIDELIFCSHSEALLEKDDEDGSLWRVCPSCGSRFKLLAKHGSIVPLHPPTRRAKP